MRWEWLYYLALILTQVIGLFLNIVGLPGLWLMVGAAAVYAWATGFDNYLGWAGLITLLALALLAELVEFLAGAAGSKVAGGSKRGMVGAIVGGIIGGIIGTPFLFLIGTIIGACLGSFVGAFAVEILIGRSTGESTRIGVGAAKGRFWGIVLKSVIGLIMLLATIIAAIPLGSAAPASGTTIPASGPSTTPASDQFPPVERPDPGFP